MMKVKIFRNDIRMIWSILSLINDYVAIIIAQSLSIVISEVSLTKIDIFVIIPFTYVFFIASAKLYSQNILFWKRIERLFYSSIYSIMAIYLIYFRIELNHSVIFFFSLWIFSFFCLIGMRFCLKKVLNKYDYFRIPLLIIGGEEAVEVFVKNINNDIEMGTYRVIGLISNNKPIDKLKNYRLLGNFNKIEDIINKTGINSVLVALSTEDKDKMKEIVRRVQPLVKNVCIIPNISDIPMNSIDVETFLNEKFMLIHIRNNLARKINKFIKFMFDYIIGIILLIPIMPILFICCIWVKLDSKGPIFYNAKRIGKNGKEFTCYKFRSMHINGDELLKDYLSKNPEAKKEWDEFQKLHDYDPRVTKAGKIMRRTSLDELPQIFNVLKGEMSLVGPRPYLPREKNMMGDFYKIIISTVPGITGYWQVNGRSDVTFEGRLKMDDWYIRNWSVWIDIVLLVKTIKAVFYSKGAV